MIRGKKKTKRFNLSGGYYVDISDIDNDTEEEANEEVGKSIEMS